MTRENSDNSILSPLNYLKIFFRRKELLLIPTFAGLILGICTAMILPKEYMSSTILLVEEGKTDNPLFDKLAVSTTVQERMSTIRESMLGWNSIVKLVKRLNMDKNIRTTRDLEDLIHSIRDNVIIKLRGRNLIDLSYVGRDAVKTQAVVQNITNIFIERNVAIQNQETSDAIIFIEEQLKVYRGKIKSAEIAAFKDQLNTLLVDSTEFHPQVKQLRDRIEAKENELKKENLKFTENINLDTTTNSPLIKEIKNALDNIDEKTSIATPSGVIGSEYYKVMLIDKLDNVMARDVGVNNNIYNMLLQRIETAKITQRLQSSKEGTRYTIIDPPRIPLDPIKPNKPLVAFIGFLAGVIVGIGLIVGFEFLDQSFLDVEEAKHFFGMPLLGAISKINTSENIRKEKEKTGWMYSLTIVTGIVMIILTTAISNFMK